MTTLNSHIVRIEWNGCTVWPHVNWESSPITVWHTDGHYIVFKMPSGTHWESIINNRVPHAGQYLVCDVLREEANPNPDKYEYCVRVRELFRMPLSNRGREFIRS